MMTLMTEIKMKIMMRMIKLLMLRKQIYGLFKSNVSILSKYNLIPISDFSCQYYIGQYWNENLLHKLIKNYTALIWSLLLFQEQKRIQVCKVLKFDFCVNLLRDTSHVVKMKANIAMFKNMVSISKLHNFLTQKHLNVNCRCWRYF